MHNKVVFTRKNLEWGYWNQFSYALKIPCFGFHCWCQFGAFPPWGIFMFCFLFMSLRRRATSVCFAWHAGSIAAFVLSVPPVCFLSGVVFICCFCVKAKMAAVANLSLISPKQSRFGFPVDGRQILFRNESWDSKRKTCLINFSACSVEKLNSVFATLMCI